MQPKLLVILQNAYGVTEKRRKQLTTERLWLCGLWNSQTGKRLKEMLPSNLNIKIINASQKIGCYADAQFPPDKKYLKNNISEFQPDVILACGRIAQQGMDALNIPYMAVPHPAWRLLSKIKTKEIKSTLIKQLNGE